MEHVTFNGLATRCAAPCPTRRAVLKCRAGVYEPVAARAQ
jgi:hypothetical protein